MQNALTRLQQFAAFLRRHQFSVGIDSTLSMTTIAATEPLNDKQQLKHLLRSCICKTPQQWMKFDILFDQFWCSPHPTAPDNPQQYQISDSSNDKLTGFSTAVNAEENSLSAAGSGDHATISHADFRFVFDPEQMKQIEQLVDQLARQMKNIIRRRTERSNTGQRMDMRKTVASAMRGTGIPDKLIFRRHKKRQVSLVLLIDVSQSMEVYAQLFLRFARELMTAIEHSAAYAFNIELVELGKGGHQLLEKDFEFKINEKNKAWLGGTKIATSLNKFCTDYMEQVIKKDTTVVIFSDGYDTDDPKLLPAELSKINTRARRIIWVDPLFGRAESIAVPLHMRASRRHMTDYCGGHNLQALQRLGRYLSR